MKVLLDENVDNRLKNVLESQNWMVKTTFEEGLSGSPDLEILRYASENDYVVLTHDDDFISLIQDESFSTSILYMPQSIGFRDMKNRISDLKNASLGRKVVYL